MGCSSSTLMGTRAPVDGEAGTRSTGRWSASSADALLPSARHGPGTIIIAAAIVPTKPRRDTEDDRSGSSSRSNATGSRIGSVAPRIELRSPRRPVLVGLQSLHGVRVGFQHHALVRLLDAPVVHVPQGGELAELLREFWKLVRMRVGGPWVAHRAGHPGLGQGDAHLPLGLGVAVKEQVAELDLLHEDLVEAI